MTSSIRKYYRKAKHEMPLCYAEKKLYLAELSETLHAIEAEQPDITYEALTEMLGTPAEQTKSYAEMLSAEELYQNIHTMKNLLCSWLCRLYDLKQTDQITLHRCNPRTCDH